MGFLKKLFYSIYACITCRNKFTVDDEIYITPCEDLQGIKILELAGKSPDDYDLYLLIRNKHTNQVIRERLIGQSAIMNVFVNHEYRTRRRFDDGK